MASYRVVLRSPGGEEREVSGEFREVVANRKLVFTWAWRSTPERQSLVTVEFVPTGDATALTQRHRACRGRRFRSAFGVGSEVRAALLIGLGR